MKEECIVKNGNELCTNGTDTYHEWNMKFAEGCPYCWRLNKNYVKKLTLEERVERLESIIGTGATHISK